MSDEIGGGHIRDIREEDTGDLALLHARYFTASIIGIFGERFLRAAYRGMVDNRWGKTIVYVRDEEILGFATIMFDAGNFFREILSRQWLVMGWEALKSLIHRPSVIRNVIYAARYSGSFKDETRAELLSIITKEEVRGMGIGDRLMEEVAAVLRAEGIARYKVSVKRNWDRAIDFYLKRGFEKIGEIDHGETGLLFLRHDIAPPIDSGWESSLDASSQPKYT